LAVMANVFPNTVIKTLVEEYEAMRTKKMMTDNNNSSAELKMKVGEVLVRVTKLLGKYYAVSLTHTHIYIYIYLLVAGLVSWS
jgi:uncharacterized membrane protein